MTKRTFVFDTTVVVQEVELFGSVLPEYRHRLVIGTIASEWYSFSFLAHMTLGGRTFMSCIDGRAVFPTVFEVISGLERI